MLAVDRAAVAVVDTAVVAADTVVAARQELPNQTVRQIVVVAVMLAEFLRHAMVVQPALHNFAGAAAEIEAADMPAAEIVDKAVALVDIAAVVDIAVEAAGMALVADTAVEVAGMALVADIAVEALDTAVELERTPVVAMAPDIEQAVKDTDNYRR